MVYVKQTAYLVHLKNIFDINTYSHVSSNTFFLSINKLFCK